jgi:sugar lactone lactonase YvrE
MKSMTVPRRTARMSGWLMIAALCTQGGCGPAALPEQEALPVRPPDAAPETPPVVDEEDINRAPLADAGPDLQAVGGDAVQLDGTGSVDDDGDVLRFDWAQTAGTPVALTGAATASPTFTAPNEDVELEFELTVTDGRGGEDFASVRVAVSARPARLFIVNRTGTSILSYTDPGSLNGNIAPDANLQGDQTALARATDVVVAADGSMIVSSVRSPAALVRFDEATATNGNVEPDGLVQGAATRLRVPFSLALNGPEDLVFVVNARSRSITVYDRSPASALNGNLAPIRTINTATTRDLRRPVAADFGADDELYVADLVTRRVLVFAEASTLNGDVAPSRFIVSNDFDSVVDVLVDRNDTMYVVDTADSQILIFENASALNGEQEPDAILDVVGTSRISAVVVDAQGTGYISDTANSAILVYDDIATANGEFLPDRIITGLQTQIENPTGLFLAE